MFMLIQATTSTSKYEPLIAVAAVVVVALLAWVVYIKLRTKSLRARFGPEYDRQLEQLGSRSKAEDVLVKRKARVEQLRLVPLPHADHERFINAWQTIQSRFVDSPESAIADADRLVSQVMMKRGYPIVDFDLRAADISVDHPVVVENYREAHFIALRHSRGEASTEELRQALIHFRALFDELVSQTPMATSKAA